MADSETNNADADADPALIQELEQEHEGNQSQTSRMNILTIDGQHWDISNLSTTSSSGCSSHNNNIRNHKQQYIRRSETNITSLYPQITRDEEDMIKGVEKKARTSPSGAIVRKKDPATMTIRNYTHYDDEEAMMMDNTSTTTGTTFMQQDGLYSGDAFEQRKEESTPFSLTSLSTSVGGLSIANPHQHSDANNSSNNNNNNNLNHQNDFNSTTQLDNPFFFADEDNDEMSLSVAPGVEVVLRGSIETRAAIANWDILRAHCLECTVLLHCIEDAMYLLCPLCRCVSPLELCIEPNKQIKAGAYGIGLGFQSCPKSGRRRRKSANDRNNIQVEEDDVEGDDDNGDDDDGTTSAHSAATIENKS